MLISTRYSYLHVPGLVMVLVFNELLCFGHPSGRGQTQMKYNLLQLSIISNYLQMEQ